MSQQDATGTKAGTKTGTEAGTEADVKQGPVQEQGEIFAVQQVGEYVQFTVVAPGVAQGFRPGHFVAVGVGGANSSMLLRRAFALYGATPSGEFAGTIQFVVAAHGPGTQWLVERKAGDVIDVVGPLGTPFPTPYLASAHRSSMRADRCRCFVP